MRFTAKTEQEIIEMSLIPPGTYNFEVVQAIEKTSKIGNEMIELKLKIWDWNNRERFLFDYLLDAMSYKLRHFCLATGLKDVYDSNCLSDVQCVGRSGKVEIAIQKGTGGYSDKNVAKDYITVDNADTAIHLNIKPDVVNNYTLNDDIPF